MADNPQEAAFEQYKEVEKEAFTIADQLLAKSARLVDLEVALVAAIFTAHRVRNPEMPAGQIASIIQGHAEQLVPFFSQSPAGETSPET
ncbi:MAG: hypothetical protein ACFE0O_02290 [Opitutales bacterium]